MERPLPVELALLAVLMSLVAGGCATRAGIVDDENQARFRGGIAQPFMAQTAGLPTFDVWIDRYTSNEERTRLCSTLATDGGEKLQSQLSTLDVGRFQVTSEEPLVRQFDPTRSTVHPNASPDGNLAMSGGRAGKRGPSAHDVGLYDPGPVRDVVREGAEDVAHPRVPSLSIGYASVDALADGGREVTLVGTTPFATAYPRPANVATSPPVGPRLENTPTTRLPNRAVSGERFSVIRLQLDADGRGEGALFESAIATCHADGTLSIDQPDESLTNPLVRVRERF